MKSDLPKVFHEILGEPMLTYVLETVGKISPQKIYVVVGCQRNLIMNYYRDRNLTFVIQEELLGTGHAIQQVEPYLGGFSGTILVLNGDVPLLSAQTIQELIDFHRQKNSAATVLTAVLEDPSHYGRIVRKKGGEVERIVEAKDAKADELKIKEINTGTFCFEKEPLFRALKEIKPENVQKEYYLTDTLEILRRKGHPAYAYICQNPNEVLGVNTKEELIAIEKILLTQKPLN